MENIRVESRNKEICVNDAGECITLPMGDNNFLVRFNELMNRMEAISSEIDQIPDDEGKLVEFVTKKTKEAMAGIDSMFGDGACRKIFGDIIPMIDLIADFFEQLMPLIDKFADERQKQITKKYNRQRGAGKKRQRTKEEPIEDYKPALTDV